MVKERIRIGIDVGGTFTKAVAVNANNMELMGAAITPTTHTAVEGVAAGVVYVFQKLIMECSINPDNVIFLAHSTTQATNALLECDVTPVGVVGMGAGSIEAVRAKSLTNQDDIEVAPGRFITVKHVFVDTSKSLISEKTKAAIQKLLDQGARTIVASEAFGVDDPTHEKLVMDEASQMGISATGAHEITKLYGLKVRTRTAIINASILPKMVETAEMTEKGVRQTGIKAPLMVMRGDGGVMSISEMRRRPIFTALSGPAASVAGVLFYLKISDGIYFEVGGTSTNMGVIKNGRPMTKHVEIGGHSTYLPSLDVRVLGVAGGSMPRVQGNKLIDVGPRSAHIAGLPYATFANDEDIVDPKPIFLKLKEGDPSDYLGIECANGKRYALTNTCAANILGFAKPGDYAYGNPKAARRAFTPLANILGVTVEEAAYKFLEIATGKVIDVVLGLIDEYKLDNLGSVLVGGGGGASTLIPFISEKTGLKYQICDNAEVISSIGDALAMVRETVERSIVNPTPDDILRVRKECEQGAIASGAKPGTIEIFVEVDSSKHRVYATAVGATEFLTRDVAAAKVSGDEQAKISAESMRVDYDEVKKVAQTRYLSVYTAPIRKRGFFGITRVLRNSIRVIDDFGVIRLNINNGLAFQTNIGGAIDSLCEQASKLIQYTEAGSIVPESYLLYEARVFDMSGLKNLEEYRAMASVELQGVEEGLPAVIVFSI